ncbi:aprataxin and PNK-like factor [Echeneis naucrates]|uniref:aprataxin and PNK-like factor n=1 Tax=Echeneis naucrates TaxID=173247 RepID=UPI0011146CB9|nr:aprataxin and PNK-like factor [Echeneis naucrates]
MSGFDLVPLAGGAPVRLPPGQTVLGRGPLLGITDKRVSRHHGLLENLSGQLRLKPTHLNPCFIQSPLADGSPRPLNKDCWYDLNHGDLFSLLPGQLVFRVAAVGDDTPRNSQILDEEEETLPGSPKSDVELDHPSRPDTGPTLQKVAAPAALSSEDHECSSRSSKQEDPPTEVEDDGRDITPSVTKKRVLPAWMMAAGPCSLKVRSPAKVKAASTGSKPAAASQATLTTMSSPEEEERRLRKRRRKISDEDEDEAAQSKTDVPSEYPTLRDPDQGPVGSGSEEVSTAGKNMKRNSSKSKKNGEKLPEGAVGSNGGSVSVPAPSKTGLRAPCPYGKDCYRKNPVHFQECSHPGDSEYEEEEEDRPECPYGTDCYRKNPLHRKQFQHTKRQARATRGIPKRSKKDEDEDSFINDDSGDGGDDSDYIPPDSEDSGKEDVQMLQEEAKTFLKRRR